MKDFRLNKHTIKGVGGFKQEIVLNFSDKTTVLLGVNGSGKTTVLNTIFYSIYNLVRESILKQIDPNDTGSKILHHVDLATISSIFFITSDKNESSSISCVFDLVGDLVDYQVETSTKNTITAAVSGTYPLLRLFKDEKSINNNESLISNFQVNVKIRSENYKGIFDEHLDVKGFTNFLIDQHNIENNFKVEQQNLEASIPEVRYINQTIERFFKKLYGDETAQIKVARSKYAPAQCLNFIFKGVELEFSQLSSGERYLFSLVLELIYRIINLNPNRLDFSTVPGIVLIDEVEDHLHPRWQLTIIEALEAAFPNVQFIVSTHSPLIASSVKREQLIALSNFEIIPSEELDDIYSDSADEVLKRIMFSDNKISKFEQERTELNQLFNLQKYEEAEEKLEAVRKLVGSNPRWIRDFERKISFARS